jgi:hypothetical protein
MCLKYNVTLTEALADQLVNGENNSRLLTQLAEVAQRQGDYQLAAKKFTQAGDKVIDLWFLFCCLNSLTNGKFVSSIKR